jgi:hypothetical protein
MAITFRAAGATGSCDFGASGTTVTFGAPAGVAATDVVLGVILFAGGTSTTITPPAGWTLVVRTDSGTTYGQAVYWALGNVSFGGSFTLTLQATGGALGWANAYVGADNTTPIDASGGQANASSTTVTAPSITTTAANDMLVGFFGWENSSGGGVGPAWSAEFGTHRKNDVFTDSSIAPFTQAEDVCDAIQAAAGASGTMTATASVAMPNVGTLIALKPSGGATSSGLDEGFLMYWPSW